METNLIITALPLVYRRENEFAVLNGLDLSRKNDLWGIQLLSGIMVALKCGPGNDVPSTTYDNVENFSETMTFNGLPVLLPFVEALDDYRGCEEKDKFTATVAALKEKGIEADGYEGGIWCHNRYEAFWLEGEYISSYRYGSLYEANFRLAFC